MYTYTYSLNCRHMHWLHAYPCTCVAPVHSMYTILILNSLRNLVISIKEVCARRRGGLLFLGLETQRESEKEMSVATRKAGRATHVCIGMYTCRFLDSLFLCFFLSLCFFVSGCMLIVRSRYLLICTYGI